MEETLINQKSKLWKSNFRRRWMESPIWSLWKITLKELPYSFHKGIDYSATNNMTIPQKASPQSSQANGL
ncbi:MAG: hypothetical protein IJ599_01355 [Alphaproteobacteria bacterium]|nr:hypothetical protein [Alphaproteobacteria bacterium]